MSFQDGSISQVEGNSQVKMRGNPRKVRASRSNSLLEAQKNTQFVKQVALSEFSESTKEITTKVRKRKIKSRSLQDSFGEGQKVILGLEAVQFASYPLLSHVFKDKILNTADV